jgi:hypothetical protein
MVDKDNKGTSLGRVGTASLSVSEAGLVLHYGDGDKCATSSQTKSVVVHLPCQPKDAPVLKHVYDVGCTYVFLLPSKFGCEIGPKPMGSGGIFMIL